MGSQQGDLSDVPLEGPVSNDRTITHPVVFLGAGIALWRRSSISLMRGPDGAALAKRIDDQLACGAWPRVITAPSTQHRTYANLSTYASLPKANPIVFGGDFWCVHLLSSC